MTAILEKMDRIRLLMLAVKHRQSWHAIVYTIIMCYIQVAFGITCTSIGPTLVDLKNKFKQKDMRVVLYYNSINCIGYIIGSLGKSLKFESFNISNNMIFVQVALYTRR